MNNYTLVITTQPGVQPDQVKSAIETLLIRATPPVTLRFYGVAQPEEQTILVALASDGKREFIMKTLGNLEDRVPARLERIEWGNQVGGDIPMGPYQTATDRKMAETTAGVFPGFNYLWGDPYAKVEPQQEESRTYRPTRSENLRSVFAFVFLLSWFLFLAVDLALLSANKSFLPDSPLVMVVMQIWLLFSLFVGPPYVPWRLISSVTCDAEGISVKYWLGKPRRLAWSEIHSVHASLIELVLYSDQKPVHFTQRMSLHQDPILVKTILTNADLVYVKPFVYKRRNAPD